MKSMKRKTKSGQAADSGRKYIYARQLSFLQQAGATTETQLSLSVEEAEESQEEAIPGPSSAIEPPPRTVDQRQKKRKRDLESALVDFIQAPIALPPALTPEPNADRAFFESLLPSISSFSEDEKLEFRSEILGIVQRMRQRQQAAVAYTVPLQPSLNMPPILQHLRHILHTNILYKLLTLPFRTVRQLSQPMYIQCSTLTPICLPYHLPYQPHRNRSMIQPSIYTRIYRNNFIVIYFIINRFCLKMSHFF